MLQVEKSKYESMEVLGITIVYFIICYVSLLLLIPSYLWLWTTSQVSGLSYRLKYENTVNIKLVSWARLSVMVVTLILVKSAGVLSVTESYVLPEYRRFETYD